MGTVMFREAEEATRRVANYQILPSTRERRFASGQRAQTWCGLIWKWGVRGKGAHRAEEAVRHRNDGERPPSYFLL